MKHCLLLLIFLITFSCTESYTEDEVVGVYTPIDYEKNYDTITLLKNGHYNRKVYNLNKEMLLSMEGKWSFYNDNKNQIRLYSFYLNLDDDLKNNPSLVKDTSGTNLIVLEYINDNLGFCVGYFANQNCYQKQSKSQN